MSDAKPATDLHTRIAAVAAQHDYRVEGNDVDCRCGWNAKTPHWDDAQQMWGEHLADAVIRELGLQREQLGEDSGYPHHQHRYVTEWFTNG